MEYTQKEKSSVGEEIGGAIGHEIGREVGKEIERNLTGQSAQKKSKKRSPFARRVGYLFGIFFGVFFLWVIGNFDTWGWRFITDEWSQVEQIVRLSIIVELIVHSVFLLVDSRIIYYFGKLVTHVVSFIVGVRMLQVSPFDFNNLFGGWGWLNSVFPWLIVLGLVGIAIAVIVRTVKLGLGKEIYD